jgi:glutamyl-tRNA reductase
VTHRLVCVGVNHKHSPVELREKVAFKSEELDEALKELVAIDGITEAMILSTCNRVELYAAGDPDASPYQLGAFLQRFHNIEESALEEHLFRKVGEDALSHLFRVGASLDAIVVGEPQILGQVKDAYFRAAGVGTTGPVLNKAMHRAFSVAKRVRTETEIASSAVSVSYAGVELARKIFGDISGLECLLVGAGDMAELAARHFVERGANIIVTNRSIERAHRLAENYGGTAREWSELQRLLEEVDVVLASTSAPNFVITKELMKRAVKRRRFRPIFFIDIAVPRDVDPKVGDFDACYVYDVDDLQEVVAENLEARRNEADRAEDIVRHEVLKFAKASRERKAVPTIKALREYMLEVAQAEADKTLVVLGDAASEKQKKSVQSMAQAIVNKVLHEPITKLKQKSARGDPSADDLFAALQELFELAIDEEGGPTDTAAVMREAEEAEDALGDLVDRAEEVYAQAAGNG